jgi:signal transduction histidine kinase
MRRFFATTLGQILAIIATSSAITFLLFLLFIWMLPGPPPPPPWPWQPAYRIAGILDGFRAVSESERYAIAAATQRPGLSVTVTQVPVPCETFTSDTRNLETVLRTELGTSLPDVTVRACSTDDPARSVQVLIGLGDQTLDIRTGRTAPEPHRLTLPFIGALLFLCVAVAAMSAWAVWRVVGPLRRLSAKADAFGQNISITPIEEEGPLEIRRAARAFNLMQERITRSIRDRTRMLAAIGHDLRTPLTRMRLQLETHQTGDVRGKLLRDIALMQAMVTSALSFLSGGFEQEDKEWLDLGALLDTIRDEYQETGVHVFYEGVEQIKFFCRPNAINRALTNLVENGTHYGEEVVITASCSDGVIVIEVADDGPGIPPDRLKDVVEPFVRLDPSRSKHAGSTGLGLSIVKEIVEAHRGTLELAQRQPHGLIARIRLPERDAEETGTPARGSSP